MSAGHVCQACKGGIALDGAFVTEVVPPPFVAEQREPEPVRLVRYHVGCWMPHELPVLAAHARTA